MSLSKSDALRFAQLCISEDVSSVRSVSPIATLWGGMGKVYKVIVTSKEGGTTASSHSFVLKYVDARRIVLSKGRASSVGDQRKLDSYAVEATFYSKYSDHLLRKGVGLAQCLHVQQDDDNSTTIICMSNLENAPYDNYAPLTIEWLAHFHAATWQQDCPGLQDVGTYWHLDTRPEEWAGMSNDGWEGRLKRAAPAIDRWLKQTPIQSWVHGDAKDANIMWDGSKIAMCDFQYVGRGCPMKDLCYFLCSNGLADDDQYVDLYYEKLCSKLIDPPSRHDLDVALELAYCDYLRFMCGWGCWGSDITTRVKTTLDKLDGGTNLGSDEAYFEAILRVL